ncbi:MAG: hypothetical protein ACXVFB_04290 [Gaiellaceae bacterium]
MRALLAVLALAALTAGCGSSTSRSEQGAPRTGSLEGLWKGSGQAVALIPGTNDYSPGDVRVSFLVVDNRGRVIAPPTARFWIARSLSAKPLQETVAKLEPVGVPGVSKGADVPALYVAHVRVGRPGKYYVLARPIGKVAIGGIHDIVVRDPSPTPAVGDRAYPSRTPTLASSGGKTAMLTTRVPPDRGLLRYSIAESLAAHTPFVVTFATPRYCESRTCGPVVDVVEHARRRSKAREFASSTSRSTKTMIRVKGRTAGCANGGFRRSRGRFSSAVTAASRRSSRAPSRRESSRIRFGVPYARPQDRRQLTHLAHARARRTCKG